MNLSPKHACRVTGAALIALVAVTGCTTRSGVGEPVPTVGSRSCTPPYTPTPLGGPAGTSLTGGPVRQPFSLDSGALAVDLPRPGDHPSVPASVAMCEALASGDNSYDAARGFAIGYARVTVRTDLLGPSPAPDSVYQYVQPTLPQPAAYQDRLAWVVVIQLDTAFGVACPAPPPSLPPTPAPRLKTDYWYEVFLLDAATGGAALSYREGGVPPCAEVRQRPTTAVPTDQVSVPWTLTSRDPDGFSARITADMTSCDGYSTMVWPNSLSVSYLQVVVQRPVGSSCAPVRRALSVHAAQDNADLPADLTHGLTGLYMLWDRGRVPRSTAPTLGAFVGIHPGLCGQTVTVPVNTVLVLPYVPSAQGGPYPVQSSAPSVVGPLDGPVTDTDPSVRAWHRGQADLTVLAHVPGAPAACANVWTVHITVR